MSSSTIDTENKRRRLGFKLKKTVQKSLKGCRLGLLRRPPAKQVTALKVGAAKDVNDRGGERKIIRKETVFRDH